jgi:asparagine synthase (glutamine-hydrolysing)
MRRLSIIDLSTGHQPIPNEDESVWIVFNGEVYDFQRLRTNLQSQGHRFRTQSDTETILHLYEQNGPAGAAELRGMFAYAIWDSRRRRLLLARDRFGKKPLYYALRPEGIYFGSEIKCLKAAGLELEIDEEALKLYFQFGYLPDPWSPYRGVRKLPPGSWLTYDEAGKLEQGHYWKLPPPAAAPPAGVSEEQARAQLTDLFDESVRIRMMADVPLGAFLSGGLDSASVVASMARQSREPIRTFSIGFAEAAYNELPLAKLVAQQYGTQHHEILVKPDAVALVEKLVRFFDEPFGDASSIPTFIVSEFARQHVKVALSGDGGDELFGGYDSFQLTQQFRRWDRLPQFVRQGLNLAANSLPYTAYGKNYLRMMSRPTALERYFDMASWPYFMRRQLLQPHWMLPADHAYFTSTFAHCLLPGDADVLDQAMYFEATAKLTGDMLVKVDRMSSANSLEVRCPLLDHRLAEFAQTLPPQWKLRDGRGKVILREALGPRLPAALLSAPKKGFGVPLGEWFRGELRTFLWDHLTDRTFLDRGIVSEPFVRALLVEHDTGRRNNYHWLWSLLMLELWFRQRTGSVWA